MMHVHFSSPPNNRHYFFSFPPRKYFFWSRTIILHPRKLFWPKMFVKIPIYSDQTIFQTWTIISTRTNIWFWQIFLQGRVFQPGRLFGRLQLISKSMKYVSKDWKTAAQFENRFFLVILLTMPQNALPKIFRKGDTAHW